MPTAEPTPVLLVDDGELDDVRELLERLEIESVEANGFDAPNVPAKVALLVTNTRHALAEPAVRPQANTHVVVYKEVSRTLRKVLERSGCDLVLQRPLNPDAFRLLAHYALYSGPERRRSRRVVVSGDVKVSVSGRSRKARLMQLSLRGCGFTTLEGVAVGNEVEVEFPKQVTGGARLKARGHVLSVRAADQPSKAYVSIAFRLLDVTTRHGIMKIMDQQGSGAELRPRGDRAANVLPRRGRATSPPSPGDRRSSPRKRFPNRVLAAGSGMSHVLLGRDLSSGGMRVRPDPDLALGDEVRLAVHGRPGLPAIMLKGVVARDDGDEGLLLRFQDVPRSIAARLDQIVESLPSLPASDDGSCETPHVVVSELLERR